MVLTATILARVGLFLTVESCDICAAVCKQWRDIFTPFLWHKFDYRAWRAISKYSSFYPRRFQEEKDEATAQVLEHKDQIRDLTLDDYTMVYATCMAGLTKLTSLTLDNPNNGWPPRNRRLIAESLATVMEDNLFDNEVLEEVFQPLNLSVDVMSITQAYWRMVLMNPGLRRLTFKIRDPQYILPLGVEQSTTHGSSKPVAILTSASTIFLTNLLPNLLCMTHLEIGQNADDFLFLRIGTELPNLKSFVHSEYSHFDPDTLLEYPRPNLQNLVFRIAVLSAAQVRAIVVTFIGLQSLSIPGCSITKEEIFENDLLEELVHPMLTTISVNDPSGLVQARVTFPKVRTLNGAFFPPNNLALQRLLKAFPVVSRLETRLESPKSSDIEDDDEEFEVQSEHQIPRLCMITTVIAYNVWAASNRIDRVFCQMDILVHLDVDWVGSRTLKQLGTVCSNLEYARFDLRERCSRELIGLFVGCPRLRECRGKGHEILADDIADSAEWTCLGMKKLEIDVVGVLRISRRQERQLSTWRLNGNMVLTEAQQDAMELQLFSHEIQRKVYARLGQLRELEELYLGRYSALGEQVLGFIEEEEGEDGIPQGLEMTLESGLEELGGIDNLQKIGFGWMSKRPDIEANVLAWLWERWLIKEGRSRDGYNISR
ncbi:hypothetical protein BGZ96_010046 [Linnemannia gamsii]|uniref:F-box domain-containing protein n=1 Tax=Linnemannia gamsii TaxID=64522 RepID=A0ABQ7JV07_9FUNG|nr:hypothetical protein BGZ96_010046 [Linnemannia gamsii]